ncbi:FtsX-like permease family protein [Serinibacter salmoneus]|uniref:ABC3 transporter permease C-terminal domain-containing protein n=1 Tax=Serinibacter salmoneus TaxID=556530 RepID=A0A2A9D2F3_9MICO|nr:FtsX-like permease family protein [Serinibacter salmoneus]PFG20898.1 hypothetical protein ATL40_2514 [Serinibacter salmoneus]
MTTLRLWLLLRRRSRTDLRDPARLTGALAVLALAVTTAIALLVTAGSLAFIERARAGVAVGSYAVELYPFLAALALVLLAVPLMTLGSAATKLAVSRRDSRLAALRLAGATTGQVTALTLLDAVFQALVGAVLGIAGYLALVPLAAQVRFQDRALAPGELWLGTGGTAVAAGVVLVIVLLAALAGLRRVAITPLGVAQRVTPPALRWARALTAVGAVSAAIAVGALSDLGATVLFGSIVAVIGVGMATVNVTGPWLMGLIGRIGVRAACTPAALLAARRVVDDPKAAWRAVGGVSLATFVAVVTAVTAVVTPEAAHDAAGITLVTDLRTGALLTLVLVGVLAAVTTGVVQAGRVIDARATTRSLVLAGADGRVLDRARLAEVALPLAVSVALATGMAGALVLPFLGIGLFVQPAAIAQIAVSVLGSCALVLAGAASAHLVARGTSATTG